MGDQYYFWLAFFVLQGIVADILILFGIAFLFIMWLAFKIGQMRRARQARRDEQATEDIESVIARANRMMTQRMEGQ